MTNLANQDGLVTLNNGDSRNAIIIDFLRALRASVVKFFHDFA